MSLKGGAVLAAVIVLWFTACHEKKASEHSIVAIDVIPSMKLDRTAVTGNSILKIKYGWKTGPAFKPFAGEMVAKVHFVNENGVIMWQDDHPIEPSARDWKPNQTYEYERIVYVPLITKVMKISATMGLFEQNSMQKFILPGNGNTGKDKLPVAEISITPPRSPDDLPEARVRFGLGWHQLEKNPVEKTSWRWIADEAHLVLLNPGRPADLYLKGWAPSSILKSPSKLTIMHGDQIVQTFENLNGNFSLILTIDPTLFSDQSETDIKLVMEPSYIPSRIGAGTDDRTLAAMIYVCYFN